MARRVILNTEYLARDFVMDVNLTGKVRLESFELSAFVDVERERVCPGSTTPQLLT